MSRSVTVRDMRVLVADDNEANGELLAQILGGAGYYHVSVTADAEDVPRLCVTDPRPDLLILDLHMPRLSGYEIMGHLRPVLSGPPYLPVLVVTADVTPDAKRRALSLGASDFLTKPVDAVEVLLRVGNLLRTHRLHGELNTLVEERTAELEGSRLETLRCLAAAGEYRDDDTGRHTERVGRTAKLIAEGLALAGSTVALVRVAAPLHDIGKIGIPDAILLKPGRLTDDEMTIMRTHVQIGAQILSAADSPELHLAREIALSHHERWDGTGYGEGLKADKIPLSARITAVADVFDALTHERPYKPAWAVDRAVSEMVSGRGHHFDPDAVDAFTRLDHLALVHAATLRPEPQQAAA